MEWHDATKETPPIIETDDLLTQGMSDRVLIWMDGNYHIAVYFGPDKKWLIPGFHGDWKPSHWCFLPETP